MDAAIVTKLTQGQMHRLEKGTRTSSTMDTREPGGLFSLKRSFLIYLLPSLAHSVDCLQWGKPMLTPSWVWADCIWRNPELIYRQLKRNNFLSVLWHSGKGPGRGVQNLGFALYPWLTQDESLKPSLNPNFLFCNISPLCTTTELRIKWTGIYRRAFQNT